MEDDVPCELLKIPREIVIILLTSIELSSDLLSRIYNLTRNRCKDIEIFGLTFWPCTENSFIIKIRLISQL